MRATWTWMAAFGVLAVGGTAAIAAGARREPAGGLADRRQLVSYGMGVAMARSFQRQGDVADLDVEAVARGMKDALTGAKLAIPEQDLRAALGAFQAELKQRQESQTQAVAAANRLRGESFLDENAKREGVKVLPSGLQYKVLEPGHGSTATDSDTVQCRYRGTRLDGSEFDSSYRRGKPATFRVASVLPGWRESLKLMPVGSKWQLFVPADLAYGDRGARSKNGPSIAPGEALVFELELLAIQPGGAAARTAAAAAAPGSREN